MNRCAHHHSPPYSQYHQPTVTDADLLLADRVQALPPELFHEIFKLILIVDTDYVKIDKHHKPPVQLQIDRTSRQLVSRLYYAHTTFELAMEDSALVVAWLDSLGRDGLERIRRLHFRRVIEPSELPQEDQVVEYESYLIKQQMAASEGLTDFLVQLRGRHRLFRSFDVLYINTLREDDEGSLKEVWMNFTDGYYYWRDGLERWSPVKRIRDEAAAAEGATL